MKDFTFDLQRFNTWNLYNASGGYFNNQSKLSSAISYNSNPDKPVTTRTCHLSNYTEAESDDITVPNGYTVTINFGSKEFTTSGKITVPTGTSLTLSSGTLNSGIITNNGTFAVTANGAFKDRASTVYKVTSGTLSFQFSTESGSEGNVSTISGMSSGSNFTVTELNGTVTEYSTDNSTTLGIVATQTSDKGNKINKYGTFTDEAVNVSDLNFNSGSIFTTNTEYVILTDSDNPTQLNITADNIAALDEDYVEKLVVRSSDTYSTTFGTLTKETDGTYSLTKNTGETALTAITVETGLDVKFASDFANIPITGWGTGGESTIFSVTDNADFTVSTKTNLAGVSASNVSLSSGALLMAGTSQTITAGSYKISGYSTTSTTYTDGVTVSYNGTSAIVGDIENGESFNVDKNTYTYKETWGLLKNKNSIYTGSVSNASVDVSNLTDANMLKLIAPDDSGVLEVGKTNTSDSWILSAFGTDGFPADNAVKYGQLTANNNTYALATVDGGRASDFNGSISLAGGETTIASALGAQRTIITDSATLGGAEFKVTALTSGKTDFVVKGTNGVTTVDDATTLTLIDGKLLAQGGQSVALGNETFTSASNMTLVADTDTNGYTITGAATGCTFGLGNEAYTVYGAGLMDSSDKILNSAKFTNSSVSVAALTTSDNWSNTVFLSEDKITLPMDDTSWFIIDNDRTTIYGSISLAEGTYTVKKQASNTFSIVTGQGTEFKAAGASFTVKEGGTGSAATIGTATDITLTSGKIAPTATQLITAGGSAIQLTEDTVGGATFYIQASGDSATIGGLDTNDEFKVGDKSYILLSNKKFRQTGTSDDLIWNGGDISTTNGSVELKNLIDPQNWLKSVFITITDGVLTLDNTAVNGLTGGDWAYIVDKDDNSKIYGKLNYDGTTYTINTDNQTGNATFDTVKISGSNKNVKLSNGVYDKTIIADATEPATMTAASEFTVKYTKSKVTTEGTAITLTGGTITLDDTTPKVTAGKQEIYGSSSGDGVKINYDNSSNTLTVSDINKVDDGFTLNGTTYNLNSIAGNGIEIKAVTSGSTTTTTVYNIDNGDDFNVGDSKFIKAAGGLLKETNGKHYLWISEDVTTDGVTVNRLTQGDDWNEIIYAPNGVLTIETGTDGSKNLSVFDVTNVDQLTYGTLTKTSDVYVLTRTSDNSTLTSIVLDGVKATFPSDCQGIPVTAGGAEFTCPTDTTFTVDATGTYAKVTEATSVTLTNGTIQATKGIPVTAVNHTINVTGGDITVTRSGSTVSVGALNTGDTFTVDGIAYEVTSAGLYNAENKQIVPGVTDTYTIGDTVSKIIEVSGSTLDLTNQKESALVYDSVTKPTTLLGTLTADSSGLSLSGETLAPSNIKTIKIPKATPFNVDFATIVNAPAGSVSVNGEIYDASSSLVISATRSSATLFSGTIKLDSGTTTAQATNDSSDLTLNSGAFTATAKDGKFTSLGGLDADESFTYGGKTYTQTKLGLMTDNTICQSLAGTTLDLSKLSSAEFNVLIAQTDGTINLSDATASALVVDNIDSPTKKLGSVTKSGNTYTVDLATKISVPQNAGTVSVNGSSYTGTTALTLNATAKTSTLYAGTVTIANGASVTADKTLTTESGSITATATDGKFTSLGDLDNGESFTYDGTTYTKTSIGLAKDKLICADFKGKTLDLNALSSAKWTGFLAPVSGVLDLEGVTVDSVVYDSATNPTTKLGNLTISGTAYTLDFAIKVKLAAGTVTVNGATYNGTTDLILNTTATTSTLYEGTVTIANGGSVTADQTLTADGSITATAKDGKFTALADLNTGESFTYGGETYTQSAIGLLNDGKISTALAGETLDLSKLSSAKWEDLIAPTDGVIDLAGVKSNALVVDNADNPTTQLGNLKVNGTAYTLDFATKVNVPKGTATVNGATYTGTTDLIISTTATTSALYEGTVTVAGGSVTADKTLTVSSGSVTATAKDGKFTTLGDLNAGESFTYDGKTYTQSAIGLLNDGKICTALAGETLDLSKLSSATWADLIAPTDGVIDLENVTGNALVVDNVSAPTEILGNLTANGSTYTLDFAATVKAPKGKITVNGATYDAKTEIELKTTDRTSTLYNGTVIVTDSVTADKTLTVHSSIEVTAVDGVLTHLANIDAGESFDYDGKTYTQSAVGLLSDGKINVDLAGSALDLSDLSTGEFNEMIQSDGNIVVKERTLSDGDKVVYVDSTDSPTKIFGTLSKDKDYLLEEGTVAPTSLTIEKTVIDIDSDLSEVTIKTINADNSETTFTVTPERGAETFNVDATGTSPVIENADVDGIIDGKIGYGNGTHKIGGKVFTIAGLAEDSIIGIETDADGNPKTFSGIEKGASVTIDGTTYTAPEIDSTLTYSAADGWYFDNYKLDSYTVNIDNKGNVTVDEGVKFTDVVSSGRTLATDGAIKLSANLLATPVTIINENVTLLSISDATGALIKDLGKTTVTLERATGEIILTAAETELTLAAAGNYTVNGISLTTSGAATIGTTSDGIALDLSRSAAVTYDGRTFSGTGGLAISADGGLTVDGVVKMGDVTINADEATEITPTAGGLTVGKEALTVTGDSGGYKVNIAGGEIVGLENIGSTGGVTVGGLENATVKTDAAGALTVDRTFTAASGTTYTIANGKLVSAETSDTISGDFSDTFNVNEHPIKITGNATIDADGMIIGLGESATILTAVGVALQNGEIVIGQDVSGFKVGEDNLTLAGNAAPVTLGISGGEVSTAHGVNGTISGLNDATIYNATSANINGKQISMSGTDCAALVMDGELVGLVGVESGAVITEAPDLTAKTSENGTFTFGEDIYDITDTVDGSVDFETDENSRVTNIANFAGSISGSDGTVNLNGKEADLSGNITLATDGENITGIFGLSSGNEINGDFDGTSILLPEGSVTINGTAYILENDADGATLTDNTITGLDKDASLTVSEGGTFKVNGRICNLEAGGTLTVNRDGAYAINSSYLPITEATPAEEIRSRGIELVDGGTAAIGAGKDSVAVRHHASVTADMSAGGLIIPLSDAVTLQNYDDDTAKVQTFEYSYLSRAIKSNEIKFGDGTMTLGDAVITFGDNPQARGSTLVNMLDAQGDRTKVGFTHTDGGTINESDATDAMILKGNYAETSSDTQKSGGSTLTSGAGNDTLLVGGGDVADAGAGENHIYITDANLRDSGATIVLDEGITTVYNFKGGFDDKSDVIRISDLSDFAFDIGLSRITLTSGGAELVLHAYADSSGLVDSADIVSDLNNDSSYKLKLTDGKSTYKAALVDDGKNIAVSDDIAPNLFYGNGSGISFSEYTGAVEVNLSSGKGKLDKTAAQFYGIDKLQAGAGNSSLIGDDEQNTLVAGTGDGSLWSGAGNDLMYGNTSTEKTGETTFHFLAGDGYDTINGFDFAASSDEAGDFVNITRANEVTEVLMSGSDVILRINGNSDDYLTLVNAAGKDFRINNLIAHVDKNISFDGLANCYVADATNATLSVGANLGDAQIWLGDANRGNHGIYYLGDIKTLNATEANGSNILAGNTLENVICGGSGTNSIWGGAGDVADTLIGGSGKNTFFFAYENGNDIVQNAHGGDVIDLTTLSLENISSTTITSSGAKLELTDGSTLDVQSNASIEYKLADGSAYTADHNSRQWIKK